MNEKKGFIKGALFGALAMLIVSGIFFLRFAGGVSSSKSSGELSSESQRKLSEIELLIDEYYLYDEDVTEEQLTDGLYTGYVSGLKDPYSVYYDEEQTRLLEETTTGQYSGIGAGLSQDKESGVITITRVYKDSPAEEAGIQEDDVLYKVDGEEVTGEDLSEVVARIKGEEGTKVDLSLVREGETDPVETTAVRRKITSESIEYEMKENQIGYIRILEFDSATLDQYQAALTSLEEQGMEGLVIDLRNNPGGSLRIVCEMLDLMLPEGLIVYTEDKAGERDEYKSDEAKQFNKPLTVLVNQYSASASEIFAGAIQDYELGEIVGMTTYGKGVVQQIFDLRDGTCVKLTISEYFTPKGRSINGEGIVPDEEVEFVRDEANKDADNQLDRAIELVRQKVDQ